MATNKRTIPEAHIIYWFLSPNPRSKGGRGTRRAANVSQPKFTVMARNANKFWCGVQKRDQVQFLPDPKLKGAHLRVEFTSTNGSGVLPFTVDEIDNSNFYEVQNDSINFRAEGYIRTRDGKRWRCAVDADGNKGVLPCTKPNCG